MLDQIKAIMAEELGREPSDEELKSRLLALVALHDELMAEASLAEDPDEFYDPWEDPAYAGDGEFFADPGGESALRRETASNPRDSDCPTCGRKNVLTRADRRHGYQCDRCAEQTERGGP